MNLSSIKILVALGSVFVVTNLWKIAGKAAIPYSDNLNHSKKDFFRPPPEAAVAGRTRRNQAEISNRTIQPGVEVQSWTNQSDHTKNFINQSILIATAFLSESKPKASSSVVRSDPLSHALISPHDVSSTMRSNHSMDDEPVVISLGRVPYTQSRFDMFVDELATPFTVWNQSEPYAWCNSEESPNNGILYVKLPKCASSTASGVAMRVADTVGRRVQGRTCRSRYRHGWASKKDRSYGTRRRTNSFLWSLIREPSKRLLSHYFFEQVSRQGMNATEQGALDFLKGTTDMKKTYMLRYLKLTPMLDRESNMIQRIMEEYDFVGISDRMAESMVVLSMIMQVPLADVVLLSSKIAGGYDAGRSGQGCIKLAPKQTFVGVQKYLETDEWKVNNWDQFFFQVVNRSLDKSIDHFGRDVVHEKVKIFHRLSKLVNEKCLDKAIFPCPETLPNHTELSKEDCYFADGGCGYRCIDTVLRKESDDEWRKIQAHLNTSFPRITTALTNMTTNRTKGKEKTLKNTVNAFRIGNSRLSPKLNVKASLRPMNSDAPLTKRSALDELKQDQAQTDFPKWIQSYLHFHRKSTEGDTIKAGVPYLVYQCYGGCAGLGGRLKAMIKSFYAAVCTKRVFLIDSPYPFPLEEYLSPKLIRWNTTFPNETVTKTVFHRVSALKNSINVSHTDVGVRIAKAHGKQMLDLSQILKTPTCRSFLQEKNALSPEMMEPHGIEEMLYHWGSEVLFDFTEQVTFRATVLKKAAGLLPAMPYVGLHLRTGVGETWKEDSLRLRRAQTSDHSSFIDCFRRFQQFHGFHQGYLAADNWDYKVSLHAREKLLKIAVVENFHIDRSLSINTTEGLAAIAISGEDRKSGKDYNLHGSASMEMARTGTLDLFAELKILVDAECLVMSKSSLSYAAHMMPRQPRCGVLVDQCTNEMVQRRENTYIVKTGRLELKNQI